MLSGVVLTLLASPQPDTPLFAMQEYCPASEGLTLHSLSIDTANIVLLMVLIVLVIFTPTLGEEGDKFLLDVVLHDMLGVGVP